MILFFYGMLGSSWFYFLFLGKSLSFCETLGSKAKSKEGRGVGAPKPQQEQIK